MVTVCAWCQRFMGFKAPLSQADVSHGICSTCSARQRIEDFPGVVSRALALKPSPSSRGCSWACRDPRGGRPAEGERRGQRPVMDVPKRPQATRPSRTDEPRPYVAVAAPSGSLQDRGQGLEDPPSVRGPQLGFRRPLGVRHQAHHVPLPVADPRDRAALPLTLASSSPARPRSRSGTPPVPRPPAGRARDRAGRSCPRRGRWAW